MSTLSIYKMFLMVKIVCGILTETQGVCNSGKENSTGRNREQDPDHLGRGPLLLSLLLAWDRRTRQADWIWGKDVVH